MTLQESRVPPFYPLTTSKKNNSVCHRSCKMIPDEPFIGAHLVPVELEAEIIIV